MSTATVIVLKTIYRMFLLRVSGKGDASGSANQLDVLKQYFDLPDVQAFLAEFDPRMMKASSKTGEKLRRQWQVKYGLRVLTRRGRNDFLGISVDIGGSRFIVYASTAAQMDEETGNAFTRHVCEAIADPKFNGMADPEFLRRRDAGEFDAAEHPSLIYAFDPTRFCRSVRMATEMYEAAARDRAAFEAKELNIDPAQGDHMRLMWIFVAYGSEMEATVGKLRRFVGRLNKARAGFFPYREGAVPLGCRRVAAGTGDDTWRLAVDKDHITSVQRLCELGLNPDVSNQEVLRVLGRDCGVVSGDPKTLGVPVHELDPAAAKRFFVRRKLEAYRDGELALEFVGVLENQMRPGSGHRLTRRWDGLNADGQPDRYGSVTYRVAFPKPTVTGPDGQPRPGWIDGVSDEEERARWNRLIALRGVDDAGRRPNEELDEHLAADLSDAERARHRALVALAEQRSHGGRTPDRVASVICRPYFPTDDAGTGTVVSASSDHEQAGRRMYLRGRGTKAKRPDGRRALNFELRSENGTSGRSGGISRRSGASALRATFREQDVTGALADLIVEGVRALTDAGHAVGRREVVLSPALTELVKSDPQDRRAAEVRDLEKAVASALTLAEGYDKSLAELRGQGMPVTHPRMRSTEAQAAAAWERYETVERELTELRSAPLPAASVALPALDASDPRDLVAGLRSAYGTGPVPPGFLDAVQQTVPGGVWFEPGPDSLEWIMVGDVRMVTETGEEIVVERRRAALPSLHGRGGAGGAAVRGAEMAARRMRDGQPITRVAAAAATPVIIASRQVTDHLRSTGWFANDALLAAAVDCPIPETTRLLWEFSTCGRTRPSQAGFDQHLHDQFSQSRAHRASSGRGAVWAYSLDVDRRADQLTILTSAPDKSVGILADALAAMTDPDDPRPRRVLDASSATAKVNAVYPPATRRLPAPGHPDGWSGQGSASLAPQWKRIGLPLCPYRDCTEQYATVLIPAVEVVALGTMVVCRRCCRAATPADHPLHGLARQIRFPQSYIAWFDAQPRRTGHIAQCAASGCTRDVGLGAQMTWQWDDRPGPAWHDDDCRAGRPTGTFTPCANPHCSRDEGAGPGSIRQEGRGRRTWHHRTCRTTGDSPAVPH